MESTQRLDAWILKNLPPPHSENLRLKVLACAIHAINNGKRPPAMFLVMVEKGVRDGKWTVPDQDIQEASRILREQKDKLRRQTEPESVGEILRRRNGS